MKASRFRTPRRRSFSSRVLTPYGETAPVFEMVSCVPLT